MVYAERENSFPEEAKFRQMFETLDRNSDGGVSKIELIKQLRANPEVASVLELPAHIRQEDGSRDKMELFFQAIDSDGDREITWEEFRSHMKKNCSRSGASNDQTSSKGSRRSTPAYTPSATASAGDATGPKPPPTYKPPTKTRQAEPRQTVQAERENSFPEEAKFRQMFETLDRNSDGGVSKIELIKQLRANPEVANALELPTHIRQEDGSRDKMELFFQAIDSDGDREITWEEFWSHMKKNWSRGGASNGQTGSVGSRRSAPAYTPSATASAGDATGPKQPPTVPAFSSATPGPQTRLRSEWPSDGAFGAQGFAALRPGPAGLRVTVLSAAASRELFGDRSEAYCACELGRTGFHTRPGTSSSGSVTWNHTEELQYSEGDSLLFTLLGRDLRGGDRVLGMARLSSPQFSPFGFDAEVTLVSPQDGIAGLLKVKVVILADQSMPASTPRVLSRQDLQAASYAPWASPRPGLEAPRTHARLERPYSGRSFDHYGFHSQSRLSSRLSTRLATETPREAARSQLELPGYGRDFERPHRLHTQSRLSPRPITTSALCLRDRPSEEVSFCAPATRPGRWPQQCRS